MYTENFTQYRLKGNCKHEQQFFSLLRSTISHKGSAISFHTIAKEMFGDTHKNFKLEEHKFMKTIERFKQLGQLNSVLAFKNNFNSISLLVSVEIS